MIEPLKSKGFWKDFDWLLLAAAILLSAVTLPVICAVAGSSPVRSNVVVNV